MTSKKTSTTKKTTWKPNQNFSCFLQLQEVRSSHHPWPIIRPSPSVSWFHHRHPRAKEQSLQQPQYPAKKKHKKTMGMPPRTAGLRCLVYPVFPVFVLDSLRLNKNRAMGRNFPHLFSGKYWHMAYGSLRECKRKVKNCWMIIFSIQYFLGRDSIKD